MKAFYREILRAAAEERLTVRRVCDQDEAGYDESPGDKYDGSLCTDEVNELVAAGMLRRAGQRMVVTNRGRAGVDRG
jgi:hypothetical protein